MKFTSVYLLLILTSCCFAEVHRVPDSGIDFTVDDSWTHDATDTWGYVILDHEKNKAIRIHNRSSKEKTLIESIDTIIKTIPKSDWPIDKVPKTRVIELRSVSTASGAEGYRVTTGNLKLSTDGPILFPNVWHYLFKSSIGVTFCVCVYNRLNSMTSEEADALVLQNLVIK